MYAKIQISLIQNVRQVLPTVTKRSVQLVHNSATLINEMFLNCRLLFSNMDVYQTNPRLQDAAVASR